MEYVKIPDEPIPIEVTPVVPLMKKEPLFYNKLAADLRQVILKTKIVRGYEIIADSRRNKNNY